MSYLRLLLDSHAVTAHLSEDQMDVILQLTWHLRSPVTIPARYIMCLVSGPSRGTRAIEAAAHDRFVVPVVGKPRWARQLPHNSVVFLTPNCLQKGLLPTCVPYYIHFVTEASLKDLGRTFFIINMVELLPPNFPAQERPAGKTW